MHEIWMEFGSCEISVQNLSLGVATGSTKCLSCIWIDGMQGLYEL